MTDLSNHIYDARSRLLRALQGDQSDLTCLRLWSAFVRMRDVNKCVQCQQKRNLSAHHVFRKCFLPNAQFEPGNGITLCRKCHTQAHSGFNGKPDMNLPMDAQGGEKAEDIALMLELLVAQSRQHLDFAEDWYYLSDSTLATINRLQGFDANARLDASRIEQAFIVWNQAPGTSRDAVLRANGFPPPHGPLYPGIRIIFG